MGEVATDIFIAAPPEAVWAVALDPTRLKDWVTIQRHLGRHDSGPPRPGYEMTQTLSLRGAPFRVHWKLTSCDAPYHAHWQGHGPAGSRAETEYRLTAEDGGTRFDYRNEFHAPLGILGRVAERAVAGDIPAHEAVATLRRLKALCEQH